MPELPDITVYLDCLEPRILGRPLERIRLQSVSLLRTVDPPLSLADGREVSSLRRVGKRIAIGLAGGGAEEEELFLVLHLMIAGRLRWRAPGTKNRSKSCHAIFDFPDGREVTSLRRVGKRIAIGLAGGGQEEEGEEELFLVLHLMIAGRLRWRAPGTKNRSKSCHAIFDFPDGCLQFTEASSKKRATLHFLRGEEALGAQDPGGLELANASLASFREAITRENHTLKRALTDPHLLSGIGNAYSDEILHRAKLSPVKWTSRLDDAEIATLFDAAREVVAEWTRRLRDAVGDGFPEKVTAFHPEMAVHGRYREPCPVCDSPVQRIVRQDHETNYCPTCQTGGKLLADRALSRLLKQDWPRSLDELELRRAAAAGPERAD